jgi:hypothetical protein
MRLPVIDHRFMLPENRRIIRSEELVGLEDVTERTDWFICCNIIASIYFKHAFVNS